MSKFRMTDKFIRARNSAQKTERRQQILIAARQVALKDGLDALTLAGIAAETGITKSAFYRYFRSKEEILAWLLMGEAALMAQDMRNHMAGCKNIVEAADRYVSLCVAKPMFCRLVSEMATNLEQNIAQEPIIAIKKESARQLEEWRQILLELGIVSDPMQAVHFVRTAYVILAGLWPVTNRNEDARQASQEAGLGHSFTSFEDEFRLILVTYARGLMAA